MPPFTMKTQLFPRPLFGKNSAPYPDPNALFFQCLVLNATETHKQKCYLVEKPENFLELSPKNFTRLCHAHFSLCFWCPLSKLPPFNFGLDPSLAARDAKLTIGLLFLHTRTFVVAAKASLTQFHSWECMQVFQPGQNEMTTQALPLVRFN